MKQIYIFRHGETDWNAQGRFQGHIDIPLNGRGREQAKDLIPYLKMQKIEAVLSSDLIRAVETGSTVTEALGIPLIKEVRLREAFLGEAQGLTWDEIHHRFGDEIAHRWRSTHMSDADISYPGGETGTQVMARSLAAIREFLGSKLFTRVGISTHGGVIRRIMQHVLPPGSGPVPIPNGVVYGLSYDSELKLFKLLS